MTSFKSETLNTDTGATLALYLWQSEKTPKAIVHINHGMSEHSARYDRFANVLNQNGYHVIAHDHRGHGETKADDAPLGQFATSDGFNRVLGDCMDVEAHARSRWPDLPLVCFGHSMGSIIGLNICIRFSDRIDAAALWNSGVDGGALLAIYSFLLSVERMFKGSDVASGIARKLTFETWNKTFKPNRTDSDWLSRDETEVDAYIADPLCGFDATNGLWSDLLDGIRAGADDTELARIRKDLPIDLLAGGKDPCSDGGKAVERLAMRLGASGIADLSTTIHPDNRHEALNELNRDQVMADFIAWLDERFG
ncbi:MAG: alpha/beta hydrolase [Pseudomonadota bacterium]